MRNAKGAISEDIHAEPWERLKNESAKAFEAFVVYRDMGADRSGVKVGQKLGKSKTLLERWSALYNWTERCFAWDLEQDKIHRDKQLKEIQKMRESHAGLAVNLLLKAGRALERLPEEDISPCDITRMIETGAKLERLSRGEATDKIESKAENKTSVSGEIKVDLSGLTDAEMMRLDELIAKLPVK